MRPSDPAFGPKPPFWEPIVPLPVRSRDTSQATQEALATVRPVRGGGHQPSGIDDVHDLNRSLFASALERLLRPKGRRRARSAPSTPPAAPPWEDSPTLALPRVAAAPPDAAGAEELWGSGPLVRSYVLAAEREAPPSQDGRGRAERRQQLRLRRAVWLAVHGVDVGPRRIHGLKVAA